MPSTYQPMPQPSGFSQPLDWKRASVHWRSREWGEPTIRSATGTDRPQWARSRHMSGVLGAAEAGEDLASAPEGSSCGHRSGVLGAAEAGEDLPTDRVVPVAEGGSHRHGVGGPRPSAQHLVVVAPEDLGVLPIGPRLEAGVGPERGRGPLPHPADHAEAPPRAGAARPGVDRVGAVAALAEIGPRRGRRRGTPGPLLLAPGPGPAGGLFPFGLGGQALAGPPGEGLGLVVRHVLDGVVEVVVEVEERAEAQDAPRPLALPLPEQRGPGLPLGPPGGTGRRPEAVVGVAAVVDEAAVGPVGHRSGVD